MDDSYITFEIATDASSPSIVKFCGAITILTVCKLQQELLSFFEQNQNVIIDLSDVTELDLAGMQLLCSAHRKFFCQDAGVSVIGHNQHIWEAAAVSGHLRLKGCEQDSNNTCLWIRGNYQQ